MTGYKVFNAMDYE